jgi:hypothetical protein
MAGPSTYKWRGNKDADAENEICIGSDSPKYCMQFHTLKIAKVVSYIY